MSKMFRNLSWFCMLIVSLAMFAGCPPAKKPLPSPAPGPRTPAPAPKVAPTPPPNADVRATASAITAKAVKVPGVKSASVIISGRTAIIGVDLVRDMEGKEAENVKKQVADVAEQDTRITDAVVTSDVDSVTRIREIARDIAAGKPISRFNKDIEDLLLRLKPKTS